MDSTALVSLKYYCLSEDKVTLCSGMDTTNRDLCTLTLLMGDLPLSLCSVPGGHTDSFDLMHVGDVEPGDELVVVQLPTSHLHPTILPGDPELPELITIQQTWSVY